MSEKIIEKQVYGEYEISAVCPDCYEKISSSSVSFSRNDDHFFFAHFKCHQCGRHLKVEIDPGPVEFNG